MSDIKLRVISLDGLACSQRRWLSWLSGRFARRQTAQSYADTGAEPRRVYEHVECAG